LRNAGVRVTREKLLRFTRAERPRSHWLRHLAFVGLSAWLGWVLFFSEHSAYRLLHLHESRSRLEMQKARVDAALAEARKKLPGDRLTLEDKERLLREVHIYAQPGEIVYIFGSDSTEFVP
jgi:hypothetical protein